MTETSIWRDRVEAARLEYELAKRTANTWRRRALCFPGHVSEAGLFHALQNETLATNEYFRVLGVFARLVLEKKRGA